MIKILIPEDIPSDNKGEAALFFGMVESLKEIGPHQITLFLFILKRISNSMLVKRPWSKLLELHHNTCWIVSVVPGTN